MKYGRILLKLSGEYLGGAKGQGFDFEVIAGLTKQIIEVRREGVEIAIVIGGGNFFRGAKNLPIQMDRVAADHIGMLATVMNSLLLKEAIIAMGQSAKVMTGLNIPAAAEAFEKRNAIKSLKAGEVLIFGGGTGNPYFSTDSAAALRALEIEADVVIKGTMVDGVYDKDPKIYADAKKYDQLSYGEVLEKNLKVMDAAAIALCRDHNLPLAVLDSADPTGLMRFLKGEKVGSIIGSFKPA